MMKHLLILRVALFLFATTNLALRGGNIAVPNYSFESPATPYVSVNVSSWQKTPEPEGFVASGGILWDYEVGIFKNTATNSPDHIFNCESNQAIWLFVVPGVGFFQDYTSVDWNDAAPSHEFDTRFEVGNSYQLTVGIVGTGGNMLPGATLDLALYYRDAASNRVNVAVTTVTNTPDVFSNNTQLVDCSVQVPVVRPSDAWAGQQLGILFLSTVDTNRQGGYWDLDNVRLTSVRSPTLELPAWTNGQFQFTLMGEPGLRYEILSATGIAAEATNWLSIATVTNLTGQIPFVDSAPNFQQRFYRARQLPP